VEQTAVAFILRAFLVGASQNWEKPRKNLSLQPVFSRDQNKVEMQSTWRYV